LKKFEIELKKRKLELTAVFLAFFVIALLKFVSSVSSPVFAENAPGIPSLFYNDRAFVFSIPGSDTYLPLKQYGGVNYIPLDIFKLLNNIKIDSHDNYTENFYIQYKNNYITFSISTERAYNQNREYANCKVYNYMGFIYVPIEIIARELGLEWEYKPEYNAGRIKEAGAIMTFDELLDKFIPKTTAIDTETSNTEPSSLGTSNKETSQRPNFPPVSIIETTAEITSLSPPVSETFPLLTTEIDGYAPLEPTTKKEPATEELTTAEPTTPENTREIQNYLMFCEILPHGEKSGKTTKVNEILSELEKYENTKAVFFLGGKEIADNLDALRKIYASGHSIGIKFERGKPSDGAADLVEELEETNALLYSALKHKTNLCIFGDLDYSKTTKYIYEDKLSPSGYFLCGHTADVFDLEKIKNADEMIDFIKQKKCNVFMFDMGDDFKKYLKWCASAANSKFYINFSYINSANINNIKNQTNR